MFEGEEAEYFRTLVMFKKFQVLGKRLLLTDPLGNNAWQLMIWTTIFPVLLLLQAWQSSGESPATWPMWTPIMATQQGDPFKAQRHYAAFHHNQQQDVSSVATINMYHHQVKFPSTPWQHFTANSKHVQRKAKIPDRPYSATSPVS